jgi:hypothetical protein
MTPSDPLPCNSGSEAQGSPKPSRREVVAGTLRLAAVGSTALTAACATLGLPKRSKAEAQYQDQPRMGQRCSGCVHFEAPNRCSVVAGDISPHGWSRYYLAKPV